MSDSRSDAFVFFGTTGDLAYKKIFPSLQAMVKRGALDVPVIGVARSSWDLDKFRARVYDSLEKHGGVDRAAFDKMPWFSKRVSDQLYPAPASLPEGTLRTANLSDNAGVNQ
jgi:glucose-6-phosphate 1-dehydrogenase